MKAQWRVLLGFVMVFIIVVLSIINTEVVEVNVGFATYKSPLIFVILCSAICGACIILFTFYSSLWKKNKEIKNLKAELKNIVNKYDEKVSVVEEKENLN